jgi:D-ribose pyranase
MKKQGILNSKLSYIIAMMGHTDKLVICDCGLPIPYSREVVDLALAKNIPTFIDTLKVILSELHIESAIIAEEMETNNNSLFQKVMEILPEVEVRKVSHEQFKKITREGENISLVRTGEASPYANIILVSGVNFD